MRFIFMFTVLLGVSAFAEEGSVQGRIFFGGFTFLSENYSPALMHYTIDGDLAAIELSAPTEKCVKHFAQGHLSEKHPIALGSKQEEEYHLPVTESCGSPIRHPWILEITRSESGEIIQARLRMSRQSGSYFTTNM